MTASSDTPRTDAIIKAWPASAGLSDLALCCNQLSDHARTLERELAACNDQREVSRKMLEGLCELRDELKAQLAACREELAKAKAALTPLGSTSLPESQAEAEHNAGKLRVADEAEQRDAARYRWLRRAGNVSWQLLVDMPGDGDVLLDCDLDPFTIQAPSLDAAIDAALREGK